MSSIMPDHDDTEAEERREAELARVAIKTALGLRLSMAKNGIRQIADFVNGMVFAGLLLQKNFDDHDNSITFSEVFAQRAHKHRERLRHDVFQEDLKRLAQHQMGLTDQSPVEMLITAGLSAESTISTIGAEYGCNHKEVLDIAAFAVVAALIAGGNDTEEFLDDIIESVKAKTKIWDTMIPSDNEMFGDIEE